MHSEDIQERSSAGIIFLPSYSSLLSVEPECYILWKVLGMSGNRIQLINAYDYHVWLFSGPVMTDIPSTILTQ